MVAAKKLNRCSLSQAAKLLKIHRLTLYYWIKKGWVNPMRDYKGWPVFTKSDIIRIKKWRNALHKS